MRGVIFWAVLAGCTMAGGSVWGQAQPPPGGQQTPPVSITLTAPAKPNQVGTTTSYDFVVQGGFENFPEAGEVRFFVKATRIDGGAGAPVTTTADIITASNPPGQNRQTGITRDPAKPQNGTYLGTCRVTNYDTVKNKYEVKVELISTNGGIVKTYTDPNQNEWILVPK